MPLPVGHVEVLAGHFRRTRQLSDNAPRVVPLAGVDREIEFGYEHRRGTRYGRGTPNRLDDLTRAFYLASPRQAPGKHVCRWSKA